MDDLQKRLLFSGNLQRLMDSKRLTRQAFANELGFKYSTVSEWLQGNKFPRKDKLEAIANYFAVEIRDLTKPPNLIIYMNKRVGEEIQKAREKMHLSQEELAHNGNFMLTDIVNWEKGSFSNVSIPNLSRLCDFLGLEASVFAPIVGFVSYRSMQRLAKQLEKEFPDIELTEEEMEQILDFAKFVIGKRK